MASVDKNERKISRELDLLDYEFEWEDYTDVDEIVSVLSRTSKNGKGNIGKPDHIYVNDNKKLLILIEDKTQVINHSSYTKRKSYISSCVEKAFLNSKIKNPKDKINAFSKDEDYDPVKYAEDGIVWYLNFFRTSILSQISLDDFFLDWRIVGVAISGDIEELYNHKVSNFVVVEDEVIQLSLDGLVGESEYISLYENIIEENLIQNISSSSKKINKQLRHVDSQKRPVLLSALMISLLEHEDEEIDNSFIKQYKTWKASSVASHIPQRVDDILSVENISSRKRKVISAELEFMKYDKILNETSVLIDILDELRVNVISKFQIASNYDIIGKFYEEFLRYAGVSNVKKGIVLTPHHITTLFTELIPVEPDDVFLDTCCGTGSFLIAGMNKLIELNKEIEKNKTERLLSEIDNLEEVDLINIINVIKSINENIEEGKHSEKLMYSETEQNMLIENVSELKKREKENFVYSIKETRLFQSEKVYNRIKTEHLIGFEMNPTMYSLSISNMMFRGDGKSQIYYEDSFSKKAKSELKTLREKGIKPSIGFINPPYGGRDNKNNPTKKEIQFLQEILKNVSNYVVMISPLSTLFSDDEIRGNILKRNTLKYVINMPSDLFEPNASTNTAISVFQVGKPQKKQEVVFYDLKDDGFVLSKSKGRTNAYGKWDTIKEEMLSRLFNPDSDSYKHELQDRKVFLTEQVTGSSEWVIQEYANTDYSRLGTKDFIEKIKDYVVYRVKRESNLIGKDINSITLAEILAQNTGYNFSEVTIENEKTDMENWKEFSVTDLFTSDIDRGKCSVAGDLLDGDDIYYLGAKKKDGGIVRRVTYDETLVTKGPCLGFITDGDGSIGYHNYIDLEEFIATTNVSVGYNSKINVYTGLFLVTILDLERPKYSFGRKYSSRIPKMKVLLPATIENGDEVPDWNYMEDYIKKLAYADLLSIEEN